jgi:hypothetical protein
MPPSKHPKGTYGGSIVSKSCAFGVHAMVATFSMIRAMSTSVLELNVTGESALRKCRVFLQIVRDVGPTVYSQTKRGDRRLSFYFPFHLLSD